MPRDVCPDPTAMRACSICTSFPEGLKVVREKEYWLSPMLLCLSVFSVFSFPSLSVCVRSSDEEDGKGLKRRQEEEEEEEEATHKVP